MKTIFAPGCALYDYKPDSIKKIQQFLLDKWLIDQISLTCCKECEGSDESMRIIICCPGCSHKYETLYPNAVIISLWNALLSTDFPFPDYHGERMSIHDSCHSRGRYSPEMQDSARELCKKMNITVVEPAHTRNSATCCGGSIADRESRIRMAQARAKEFTEESIVVYCTGCARSFSTTNKAPRHLLDLLFNELTEGLTVE